MKQTMKSKTSRKCNMCTEAWVSSTKGTTRDFESFRSTLKQTLTKLSMKLHENYFNPGPLTDSGFKKLSRCQANLQESVRTSVEPTVNGQPRLMAISGERSPGIERGLAYDSSPGGLELETYTWNPGSMNLYPDFYPAGFLHRYNLTKFRRRTAFLEASPVKAELALPYTKPNDKISHGGIVEMLPCSTTNLHRRRIFNLSSLNSKTPSMGCSGDKTLVRWQKPLGINQLHHSLERWQKTIGLDCLNHSLERWQKTIGLNWLNRSLIKLGFLCEVENSLSKSGKLFVC
jgi:hypothetical protein